MSKYHEEGGDDVTMMTAPTQAMTVKTTKEKTAFTTATAKKAELLCLKYFKFNRNNNKTWQEFIASLRAKDKKMLENSRKEYQKGEKFTLIRAIKEQNDEIPKNFDAWCEAKLPSRNSQNIEETLSKFGNGEGQFKNFSDFAQEWTKRELDQWWSRRKNHNDGKNVKMIKALLNAEIPLVQKWLDSEHHKHFNNPTRKRKAKVDNSVQKLLSLFGYGEGKFNDFGEFARSWNPKTNACDTWYKRRTQWRETKKNKHILALLKAKIPKVQKWLDSEYHKTFDDDHNYHVHSTKEVRLSNKQKMEKMMEEHADEMEKKDQSYDKKKQIIETINFKFIKKMKKEHAEEMAKKDQKHVDEMERMKREHIDEMERMKREHSEEMKILKDNVNDCWDKIIENICNSKKFIYVAETDDEEDDIFPSDDEVFK